MFVLVGAGHAQGPAGFVSDGRVTGSVASAFSRPNVDSADQATTKKVRDSIAADKSLSLDARNIQIVTMNGRVTLTGAVRSNEVESAVVAKATAIAGSSNVKDHLSVTPAKS
jgi:hypothetical protein